MLLVVDPAKTYQSLMISSADHVVGQTYGLVYGADISGASLDGAYYTDATLSGTSSQASVVISDMTSFISQDGSATTYSGMGGMGDMGGGAGQPATPLINMCISRKPKKGVV